MDLFAARTDISIVDRTTDLCMYHFNDAGTRSDTSELPLATRECRGIVCSDSELAVIVPCLPVPVECPADKEFPTTLINARAFKSVEGTLLRAFYYGGKWRLATYRKIDAYSSRWGSDRSFGELFEEAIVNAGGTLKETWDSLDDECVYAFVLASTPDTRIVCYGRDPAIFHVGTFHRERERFIFECSDVAAERTGTAPAFIPSVEWVPAFTKDDDIRDQVYDTQCCDSPGITFIVPCLPEPAEDGEVGELEDARVTSVGVDIVSITHPDYAFYATIRGCEPDPIDAYFRVRMNQHDREMIQLMYGERYEEMEEIENTLYQAALHITDLYLRKYVHRQKLEKLPDLVTHILVQAHKWHCEDRANNFIKVDHVIHLINELGDRVRKCYTLYAGDMKDRSQYLQFIKSVHTKGKPKSRKTPAA